MAKLSFKHSAWGPITTVIKDSLLIKLTGKVASGKPGQKPRAGRKGKGRAKDAILAFILKKRSVKRYQIVKAVKVSGPTLWKALTELIREKKVEKTGRGVYAIRGAQAASPAKQKPPKAAKKAGKILTGKKSIQKAVKEAVGKVEKKVRKAPPRAKAVKPKTPSAPKAAKVKPVIKPKKARTAPKSPTPPKKVEETATPTILPSEASVEG